MKTFEYRVEHVEETCSKDDFLEFRPTPSDLLHEYQEVAGALRAYLQAKPEAEVDFAAEAQDNHAIVRVSRLAPEQEADTFVNEFIVWLQASNRCISHKYLAHLPDRV
jgi:hypothetical protein